MSDDKIYFGHEVSFELGPSHGFKGQKGSICTCDLCQYVSIDSKWFRANTNERHLVKIFSSCKSEQEFCEIVDKIKKAIL